MEVFIHEDYVNKRNEVRREQRRKQLQMLQMEQALAGVSPPAPEARESPRVPAQCLTPTGGPSTTVRSPTASATAAAAEAAETVDHRLFDCLKPY
uniref:Uncharacterized protein n=1 Tax=Oryza meridionalis TaxID=40149 RepID=A0A0E0DDL2_9ORYZ